MRLWVSLIAGLALAACDGKPAGYPGYIEGDYVRIALPVAGQLQSLAVTEGQAVAAGAPLFELEHVRETAAVAEAQGRFEQAQAQLADLQKGKRADEIAVIRAQLEQARAQLALAQTQRRRQQELYEQKVVPRDSLDVTRAEQQRAEARVAELAAALRTGELAARGDAIAGAQAQVRSAQASLAQAQWALTQRAPAAPAAGLVADVYFRVGEWVPAGVPVVSLLPPQNRIVRFYVPEPDLAGLATGQTVHLSCDGCGAAIAATVSWISPEAEFTPPVIYSREQRARLVFRVEARPAAADAARLAPGLPVEVVHGA
ncbi:MAG TPA: HlyD family efflux transporter periplasmic adaptor subunit [Solimonas sp.]|nr:HlyD family efflux transporter periplasmic adaptor subunit [Solimonas sp.]